MDNRAWQEATRGMRWRLSGYPGSGRRQGETVAFGAGSSELAIQPNRLAALADSGGAAVPTVTRSSVRTEVVRSSWQVTAQEDGRAKDKT